ncbi:hypothetical protein GYMLUDRAFT_163704, partial [Collybiopsis luxurians FD-317 M1]
HEGHMAQFSLTQGAQHIPAHAKQLSYGVSYIKNLTDGIKIEHDEDVIGISAILWNLILSTMPMEITQPIIEELANTSVPHMASKWVQPGKGYHLKMGNLQYIFGGASRSPPEVYLTWGYSV